MTEVYHLSVLYQMTKGSFSLFLCSQLSKLYDKYITISLAQIQITDFNTLLISPPRNLYEDETSTIKKSVVLHLNFHIG